MYTAVQIFFLKKIYALQGCIYLIKYTEQKGNFVRLQFKISILI